jgi:hypothetical protein
VATVVGPLCTPLDLLADRMELPQAEVGDLVVVFQSGAYGASASPQGFLLGSDPGGARVRYDYGTGGAYTYAVCREGASTYHFCGSNFGGRNITNASIQAGQVGCSTVSRRTR